MSFSNQLNPQINSEVFNKFVVRWQINQSRSWRCIWERRDVWLFQFLQKLNLHTQVSVPLFYHDRNHIDKDYGDKMIVVTGETVSNGILAFAYSEVALTSFMIHFLRNGQTFVDVGTHFGYEALLSCKLVGKEGQVFCFEPNPSAFVIAKKNLQHLSQSKIYQLGIADKSKTLRLQNRPIWESAFNSVSSNSDDSDSTEISVTCLDEIFKERIKPIDFIKCDVEGFEMNVLKGADRILSEDLPILVLEADMPLANGLASPRAMELANYLKDYGYSPFSFDFDGDFKLGRLNSFPTYHANIAFFPDRDLERLGIINL